MGARGRKSAAELASQPVAAIPPRVVRDPRIPGLLGEHGLALWREITAAYQIDSAAACQLLYEACSARDRAESCRDRIERDGVVTEGGREHPLVKHELAARAFVARVLQRLELEL
jgi:hypothetical protein